MMMMIMPMNVVDRGCRGGIVRKEVRDEKIGPPKRCLWPESQILNLHKVICNQ